MTIDSDLNTRLYFLDKYGITRSGIVNFGKFAANGSDPIFTFFPKNLRFIRNAAPYLRGALDRSKYEGYPESEYGNGDPREYSLYFTYYNPMQIPDDAYNVTDYFWQVHYGDWIKWKECHAILTQRFAAKIAQCTSELARYLNRTQDKDKKDGMMAGEDQFDPLNATWEFNDLHPKAGAYMSFDRIRERYLKASENFGDSNRIDILAQSPVGDSNTPQYMSEYDIMNQ